MRHAQPCTIRAIGHLAGPAWSQHVLREGHVGVRGANPLARGLGYSGKTIERMNIAYCTTGIGRSCISQVHGGERGVARPGFNYDIRHMQLLGLTILKSPLKGSNLRVEG